MFKIAKALIPNVIKLRFKSIAEYISHLPAIVRLMMHRRKYLAINLISRDRRVTFVSDYPGWRELKLAYGLNRAGWDVTLLRLKDWATGSGKQSLDLDYSSFHDVRQFQSSWEALEMAHQAETKVFHNFSHFDYQTSIRLLRKKPGRVIFDFYDNPFSIHDGLPVSNPKKQEDDNWRFCIENADAICARDLQLQYRRKELGIGRAKPLILFPEYCWNDRPLPERRADAEIHIVQIGWMGLETVGEVDTGCYQVFEKFVAAGCHLHIYRHPVYPSFGSAAFEAAFADYIELGKNTGRVHLHPTVSPEKLVDELMKYDFGASINNGLVFDIPWSNQNPVRFPLCGSSRLFDYLDAGLGMIIHKQLKFMMRTYRPYGTAFDAGELLAEEDIKSALSRRPDRAVIRRARTELSIDHNISRLTALYDKLKYV
jgi:hypothetical protein